MTYVDAFEIIEALKADLEYTIEDLQEELEDE